MITRAVGLSPTRGRRK